MTIDIFNGLEEVSTVGQRLASWLLQHDYRLLKIGSESRSAQHSNGTPYVKWTEVFVLGRPQGVAKSPPMPDRDEFVHTGTGA